MDNYQIWLNRFHQSTSETPASEWEQQYGADTVRIWKNVRIACGQAFHHRDAAVVLVFRQDGEIPLKLYKRY